MSWLSNDGGVFDVVGQFLTDFEESLAGKDPSTQSGEGYKADIINNALKWKGMKWAPPEVREQRLEGVDYSRLAELTSQQLSPMMREQGYAANAMLTPFTGYSNTAEGSIEANRALSGMESAKNTSALEEAAKQAYLKEYQQSTAAQNFYVPDSEYNKAAADLRGGFWDWYNESAQRIASIEPNEGADLWQDPEIQKEVQDWFGTVTGEEQQRYHPEIGYYGIGTKGYATDAAGAYKNMATDWKTNYEKWMRDTAKKSGGTTSLLAKLAQGQSDTNIPNDLLSLYQGG